MYPFLPIGSVPQTEWIFVSGMESAGFMWNIAAMIMLPFAVVLLLIQVSIGVITRSARTLNIFSFAFPVTMMAAFFLVYVSAGTNGTGLSNLASEAIFAMQQMLESMLDG